MLKKFIIGMSCFALMASITACGNKDSTINNSSMISSTESVESTTDNEDISISEQGNNEIIHNMLTNLQNASSVEATLEVKVNIELLIDEESYNIPITISGTNTKSGNVTYANITSIEDLSELGQKISTTIQEQYSLKNDDIYTLYSKYIYDEKDYDTGWVISESTEDTSIVESINAFEGVADKALIENIDDGYKITINIEDLNSDEASDLTMGIGVGGDFVIYVNKDYYPTKIAIENFDMSNVAENWFTDENTDVDGFNMSFDFNIIFDKWNSVDTITIPDEVLSNAAEYQVNVSTE